MKQMYALLVAVFLSLSLAAAANGPFGLLQKGTLDQDTTTTTIPLSATSKSGNFTEMHILCSMIVSTDLGRAPYTKVKVRTNFTEQQMLQSNCPFNTYFPAKSYNVRDTGPTIFVIQGCLPDSWQESEKTLTITLDYKYLLTPIDYACYHVYLSGQQPLR